MRGSSLRDMHARGMKWNLPFTSPKPVAECIEAAHRILEPFDSKATVHGDIHLRNILARDVNDAYLIDYSYSGPGHPAHDLTRLECCMYFQYLRPLDTEDSFVELQRAVSVECVKADELERRFESWHSSTLNRTLLQGAVYCRDRCLEVLRTYGLGLHDYLAAKFILSCYSVSLPALQLGFVRSTIRALAPEF
jgi:aminoglycoside phosphotransferase (APT) family kinase protein